MKITALTTDQDLYNQINESRENYDISDLLDIKPCIRKQLKSGYFSKIHLPRLYRKKGQAF